LLRIVILGAAVACLSACGGTLSGNTYTTGTINSNCTVTANFAAAFTWISGPDTGNGRGIYGTQGVAAATNIPGPRDKAAAWTDKSGQQWLFGGEGYDSNGTFGELNDLWEYSPSSGEWTWMGGSNAVNATGIYGTQGVAAATNMPGARNTPATWMDVSGNVWLFGGLGVDSTGAVSVDMNDLWKLPAQ
jgi:N-acetylneuraminic acid mutarotase